MRKQLTRITGVFGVLVTSACAGMAPAGPVGNSFAPSAEREAPRRTANGTVIEAGDFGERGGTLLRAVSQRMRNMQVSQSAGGCPRIALRGQKSIQGDSNPRVYVDGQPAMDTCILNTISTQDVQRIEVYPMGVAPRPGYLAHPYGLILVFTRVE